MNLKKFLEKHQNEPWRFLKNTASSLFNWNQCWPKRKIKDCKFYRNIDDQWDHRGSLVFLFQCKRLLPLALNHDHALIPSLRWPTFQRLLVFQDKFHQNLTINSSCFNSLLLHSRCFSLHQHNVASFGSMNCLFITNNHKILQITLWISNTKCLIQWNSSQ